MNKFNEMLIKTHFFQKYIWTSRLQNVGHFSVSQVIVINHILYLPVLVISDIATYAQKQHLRTHWK